MQFKLKTTLSLALDPKLTWILFSKERNAFIVGDERKSFALPLHQPDAASSLSAEPMSGSCNLPIPTALYDEFRQRSWHGLQFLERDRAQKAPSGDLLRLLTFGPDYGDCLLHPAPAQSFHCAAGPSNCLLAI